MTNTIWDKFFGGRNREDNTLVQIPLRFQFYECISYDEKVKWIESERGQQILTKRPVLFEYYKSGKLYKLFKNQHWSIRLNEWLLINDISEAVPFGLTMAVPKSIQDRENIFMHPPHQNPSIIDMFSTYPTFLQEMPLPSTAKYNILTEGYAIFENIIPLDIINSASAAISKMIVESENFGQSSNSLKLKAEKDDRISELDPFFTSGSSNHKDILALYYASPIYNLVESLLHNETVNRSDILTGKIQFHPRVHGAQVAFRFSQARPLHFTGKLGGMGWHIDGMDKGKYGSFSLLIGVALNDQLADFAGNFCVHPGSHYTLQSYIKQYAAACDDSFVDNNDPTAIQAHRLQAVAMLRNMKQNLGEPVQVKLRKGDVVFVLHKIAHRGGPNYSQDVRKMVFFRLSHRNIAEIKKLALDDIWLEYEGMRDILE